MFRSVAFAALLIATPAAAGEYCADDAAGACDAAVEIYDLTDTNPVTDLAEDQEDSDGISLSDEFEESTESQDDWTGEEVSDE